MCQLFFVLGAQSSILKIEFRFAILKKNPADDFVVYRTKLSGALKKIYTFYNLFAVNFLKITSMVLFKICSKTLTWLAYEVNRI